MHRREVGHRDVLRNSVAEASIRVEDAVVQGSMISPWAVNTEATVFDSASDGGNPEASTSHQWAVRMIYWCPCTSQEGCSLGLVGCQDLSCRRRLVSLWAEWVSGNPTDFSVIGIANLQLQGILQIILPCGSYCGLQGDLGSAEVLQCKVRGQRGGRTPGFLLCFKQNCCPFLSFLFRFCVKFCAIQ